MGIKYRPREKEHSEKIARFISSASDGGVEYLVHDLVPRTTLVQVVANNLGNNNYPHSYTGPACNMLYIVSIRTRPTLGVSVILCIDHICQAYNSGLFPGRVRAIAFINTEHRYSLRLKVKG